MTSLLTFFPAFVAFFFGFSVLIFIHELGHFVVARMVGIKCTQFAIGMGTAIFSWRRGLGFRRGGSEVEYDQRIHDHLISQGIEPRDVNGEKKFEPKDTDQASHELGLGETEYRFNWLPLGGYVKMLGQEDMDPAARSNDPRSFNSKTVGARMAVISAGVIMNMILGVILLTWAFTLGVPFATAIVGGTAPGSPARTTYAHGHEDDPDYLGLEVGDKIVAIDGSPIKDMMDLRLGVALSNPAYTLDVEVERPDRADPLHFLIKPVSNADTQDLLAIGMKPTNSLVVANDAAEGRGIKKGMVIIAVNGQPVKDYRDYYQAIMAKPSRASVLTFTHPKDQSTTTYTTPATPQMERTEAGLLHLLGFQPAIRVAAVVDGPAEKAGLQQDDVIAQLGDKHWPTFDEIYEITETSDDQPLSLVVIREGERTDLGYVTPKNNKIGLLPGFALNQPIIRSVLPDTPTASLNLPAGSRLLAINDQPIHHWAELQAAIAASPSNDLQLRYIANIVDQPTEEATITLTDEQLASIRDAEWWPPTDFMLKQLELPLKGDNLVEAAALGFEKTGDFMTQAYLMIARLAQGSVKPKHLTGPIGIVHAGTQLTLKGWPYYLFFLGLLSVNLAVINFLPIPIVDGGHAVFLIVEKLKGSPVSANVQAAATYVGLGFLGLVFVVVTYYDIMRFIP